MPLFVTTASQKIILANATQNICFFLPNTSSNKNESPSSASNSTKSFNAQLFTVDLIPSLFRAFCEAEVRSIIQIEIASGSAVQKGIEEIQKPSNQNAEQI